MYRNIVKSYDTLLSIANRFGVKHTQFFAANSQILHNNYIIFGQMPMPGIATFTIAPEQLQAIKTNAENIIDDINNQDWNNANNKLSVIKSNFDELQSLIITDSVSPSLLYNINSTIMKLDEEIASMKSYESRVLSNLITLYTSYLLDYYKAEIPTDIDKLNYAGRAIILNLEKFDWNTANDNFDFVNVIWKDLKPRVPSEYNQDIMDLNQIIDSLGQLIEKQDSAQTIIKVNDMLDKIDILEEHLEKQNEINEALKSHTSYTFL